ncbi:Hypothetical predicted protein [Cloeon dipterum]|uniref:Uncharacterized protein n=1 Tax=Cloeon dipterum TaxID=197152 RepID=A0A8S1EEN8_9INSE|nr:Hypothetical predicted protein [Cloeon dipterum]
MFYCHNSRHNECNKKRSKSRCHTHRYIHSLVPVASSKVASNNEVAGNDVARKEGPDARIEKREPRSENRGAIAEKREPRSESREAMTEKR